MKEAITNEGREDCVVDIRNSEEDNGIVIGTIANIFQKVNLNIILDPISYSLIHNINFWIIRIVGNPY